MLLSISIIIIFVFLQGFLIILFTGLANIISVWQLLHLTNYGLKQSLKYKRSAFLLGLVNNSKKHTSYRNIPMLYSLSALKSSILSTFRTRWNRALIIVTKSTNNIMYLVSSQKHTTSSSLHDNCCPMDLHNNSIF